jgi:hypothetical protein
MRADDQGRLTVSGAGMDLPEQIERYCATKVELMTFREETAVNFGKVYEAIALTHLEIAKIHLEIAKVDGKIAALETRLIKWFVGTSIAIASFSFAVARYYS